MNLGFNLMKTSRLVTLFFDRKLKSVGVSSNQFYTLLALSKSRKNITDYAKELGMERTTLSRNLRTLKKFGLVIRNEGYTITESGKETLEKCEKIMDNAHNELSYLYIDEDENKSNFDVINHVLEENLEILKSTIGVLNGKTYKNR